MKIRWNYRFTLMLLVILVSDGWWTRVALGNIEGKCVPTPPCYCNEECFRCGPGGCSKSNNTAPAYDYDAERRRKEAEQRQKAINDLNEEGIKYYNNQDWDKAIELFEEALRLDPKNDTARTNLQNAQEAKKQQIFDRNKADGLEKMKGVSTGNMKLKSGSMIIDQHPPIFGYKGVGDTGIKDVAPDKEQRDLSTAWKRIHSASEIANYAVSAAIRAANSGADSDFVEARYLANESIKALNGETLGVACSPAPAMPKLSGNGGLDPKKLLPVFRDTLNDSIKQAEEIKSVSREIESLKAQEKEAKDRVEELKKQPAEAKPPTQDKPKDDYAARVDKAYQEQKAFQEKDKQRIDEVYKEQKEKESAMEAALAALKNAQSLINKKNSEKDKAFNQLNRNQDIIKNTLVNSTQTP